MSKRWLMPSFGALLAGMVGMATPGLPLAPEAPVPSRRKRKGKRKSVNRAHRWRRTNQYPEHGAMVVTHRMSPAEIRAVEKRLRKCAKRLALPATAQAPSSRPAVLVEAA